MALMRILVDGYSLLHQWPELAPGKPRHSAAAREELICRLTQYHDAVGTALTIVFDGAGARDDVADAASTPEVEVLYSRAGQSADQVIERVAHRMSPIGEVLVVTNDVAERHTVSGSGAMVSSCANFVKMVEDTLGDLEREIQNYNQKERSEFNRIR